MIKSPGKRHWQAFILLVFLINGWGHAVTPPLKTLVTPKLSAPCVYLVDFATGTVLFEKEATTPITPSSMTKLATLYELFAALQDERLILADMLPVSEKAWNARGSRSFLKVGDHISVEDLIRCIIVHSGNDACIVVAEALCGSESLFADTITARVQSFGAQTTAFKNATGWPDKGHYSSAADLALIAQHLIADFPQYYHYFCEKEFVANGILQHNRNTLLWRDIGVDGLKTGRTDAGGYGIVVSAIQKGQRLIGVVNGCKSDKERVQNVEELLHWGFSAFAFYQLADKNEPISSAEVWLGEVPNVDLVTDQNVSFVVPRHQMRDIKVEVIYNGPLETPIKQGDRIAVLRVSIPEREPVEYPLFAGTSVKSVNPFKRIQAAITYLLFGTHSL
ncbi:MAG: D-alanyl-D-alanine carboxypeptidase [Holosporales bacterium]|jgi:D-alanyl-D-alanine carboxypeptidase (penicillin-binding protein 5/6)|nr:D-alanyl-D-alanine carboxypeptidase [Holosporales bacterium]